MPDNKTLRDTRLENLLLMLGEHNNNRTDLARTIRKAPAQLTQWLNRTRTITEDSAREIEQNAKKPHMWLDSNHGARTVAEPAPKRAAPTAEAWPFSSITSHQLRRLSAEHLRLAEDQLKALLRHSQQQSTPDWRRIALEVAAFSDSKVGSDTFTQYCLAVDRQYERELAKAQPAPPTKTPSAKGAKRDVHRDQ